MHVKTVTFFSFIQECGLILNVDEYRKFTIESITTETKDSYRYRFTLPYGQALGLKTGQHIIIRYTLLLALKGFEKEKTVIDIPWIFSSFFFFWFIVNYTIVCPHV